MRKILNTNDAIKIFVLNLPFNAVSPQPDPEFLDVIGTKLLRVFLLAINSHFD
jgi:hypothetical protein